jgi:hypothetical protein
MSPQFTGRTRGIFFFALFIFVLFTIPKANLRLGPIPLYLIDLFVLFLLVVAPRRAPPSARKTVRFSNLLGIILLLALLSEVMGMVTFGFSFETVYQSMRTVIAFLVFPLTVRFIRSPSDLRLVLQATALALLFTSLLMIMTSIPQTRNFVINGVMSYEFLEPNARGVVDKFEDTEDRGVRGQTLVGISILSAAFINVCWPLVALLLRWPEHIGLMRNVAVLACLVAPFAVLMSYSRGAITSLILIILFGLLWGLNHVRRGILFPAVIFGIVVFSIGVGSSIFFFDRLVTRTTAALNPELAGVGEHERLHSYTEPFEHVIDHPGFFFLGEGVTVRYAASAIAPQQMGKATHSVFSIAYYSYGMIAAIIYIFLIYRILFFTAAMTKSKRGTLSRAFAQALFLVVVGLVPWLAFAHGAVSASRGSMLLFFVVALVASLDRFRLLDANLNRATRPASLELRKGSTQQALTTTKSTGRNENGFYT